MGKALVLVSLLLVVAIVLIAGFATGLIRLPRQAPPVGGQPPASAVPQNTLATAAPVTPQQLKPTADVRFDMVVTNVSGSGLSRTITAQITNSGTADAHNVWAKVEASSQGSPILLSGQDFLKVNIGTIAAGKAVTSQVALSIGLADGLKVTRNGANFTITIYSDENTVAFNYNYTP